MYIHIGNRRIISGKKIIGIFNHETLVKSELNTRYLINADEDARSVIIAYNNEVISSNISPYTIIKRTDVIKDSVWSRRNDD
jgi:regulator of extracellular matrix RemA (YlzA/DUF370 family)